MDFDALHGKRATGSGNARKQSIVQTKDQRDLEASDEVTQEEADSASSLPAREDDFPTGRACSLESYSIPKQDARPSFSRQDERETVRLDTPIGELERKSSGMGVMYGGAGSGAESDAGEEGKRFQPGKPNPGSQFKGVVPQPNGRWGAQIYEKHQRVWLGTFNKQQEAARAYDRAALKFRGRDTMTNFTAVEDADTETVFLEAHTKEQVVDMLRRHTYEEELEQSKKMASKQARGEIWEEPAVEDDVREGGSGVAMMREHMFDKVLTPSDVGKLNRLVIPKQHAERCFPLDPSLNEKGLLLNFEDPTSKLWRFRFSYWNSSQSYVLTKGWSRFVKEKQLDAGDIVSFERGVDRKLFFISSKKRAQEQQLHLSQKEHQLTMAAAAAASRTSHLPSGPFGSVPASWFHAFGDVFSAREKLTQTEGFNPRAESQGFGLSGSGFPWRSGGMGTPVPSMALELSHGSNPSFFPSDRSSTIEAQDFASHIHQSRNEDFARLQKLNLSMSHPEVDTTLELGREGPSASPSNLEATGGSNNQGFRLFGVDLKPSASQSHPVGNISSEQSEEAQDFLAQMRPATDYHFKRARSEEHFSLRKAIAERDFLDAGKRKSSEIPCESLEESCSKSFKSPSI